MIVITWIVWNAETWRPWNWCLSYAYLFILTETEYAQLSSPRYDSLIPSWTDAIGSSSPYSIRPIGYHRYLPLSIQLLVSTELKNLNVVSWLVARFAIVPNKNKIILNPCIVWNVHYCGKKSWETILFLGKLLKLLQVHRQKKKVLFRFQL